MKGVWKFVGGCFVGAASAIVVSPKSGSELRRTMALRLAHGLERAAGEAPEGTPAPGGRRTAQETLSRTAVAGVMSTGSAAPVGSPPTPVAAPVSGAPDDTVVRPWAVSAGEPERPGRPPLETPAVAAPAAQEPVAPPPASTPHAIPAPIPEAFAPSAVEPATEPTIEPLPAEPQASLISVSEAEEVEMPASEGPPTEPETLGSYVPPAFAPDVSTVEGPPAETVSPEPAEVSPQEAAMRPETAVLAAAAQSAAAIGTPAMDVEATPEEAPEASGIDDLRARIEQTKAAVREALEKPFSDEEQETWRPEGSGAAYAPDTSAVGDEDSTFLRQEESVAAIDDQTTGLEDLDVRSAFAEGSVEGVWMVPEVGAQEQAGTAPSPAMEDAEAEGAAAASAAPMFEVDTAPVAADEAQAPSTVAPPESTPQETAAAAGPEMPLEPMAATAPIAQAGPVIRPESPAAAESVAEAGTAEASVWEPVGAEEPAPSPAVAPDAAVQAPPASELDQAVADAFASPDETSASPETAVVDQAEMRRRIEETRSRLKAKAFDAMTSGEAALLAHEPSETTASAEIDEPLDDEVQAVIDRSLSQDDY